MALDHLSGVSYSNSAAQDKLSNTVEKTSKAASEPSPVGNRVSYGKITAVDHESGQVKVRMFREPPQDDLDVMRGAFLPLLTSLSEVHLLWGSLREGLACRIYWRGRDEPQQAIIEIVGDEDTTNFLKQPVAINEINTGTFKILLGGMGV